MIHVIITETDPETPFRRAEVRTQFAFHQDGRCIGALAVDNPREVFDLLAKAEAQITDVRRPDPGVRREDIL